LNSPQKNIRTPRGISSVSPTKAKLCYCRSVMVPSLDFDVAIIGGGIAGAAIARDAALRGLTTVLFEKNTFGSGASSKSSKLIHGGIRYLETAWERLKQGDLRESWKNLRFVFSALRESRILRKIAPDLVTPHPILIPIYASDKRSRWIIYLGAILYSKLTFFAGSFRRPRLYFSAKTVLKELPELDNAGLVGAVKIWDHVTDDLKLVLALIGSARAHGAACFEHAEVASYRHDFQKNAFELKLTGGSGPKKVWTRKLINAGGAWVDEIRERGKEHEKDFILPIAGAHINVKRFLPHSVLLQAQDGRFFFVNNLGELSRIGTTERTVKNLDKVNATADEVDYLLRSVSRYFPAVKLTKKDVLSTDAGVRPLAAPGFSQDLSHISREHMIRVGPTGVVHVISVKLTDHRRAAQEVLDRLIPSLLSVCPKAKRKTSTHRIPLTQK